MVSPYLERRLRSYREALREIRRRHAAKRALRAREMAAAQKAGHLSLVRSESRKGNGRGPDA